MESVSAARARSFLRFLPRIKNFQVGTSSLMYWRSAKRVVRHKHLGLLLRFSDGSHFEYFDWERLGDELMCGGLVGATEFLYNYLIRGSNFRIFITMQGVVGSIRSGHGLEPGITTQGYHPHIPWGMGIAPWPEYPFVFNHAIHANATDVLDWFLARNKLLIEQKETELNEFGFLFDSHLSLNWSTQEYFQNLQRLLLLQEQHVGTRLDDPLLATNNSQSGTDSRWH